MTRTLTASLVTLGDPDRVSGGYLYHRRLAEAGPAHGARVEFVSYPDHPFPLPALAAREVAARAVAADVVVLDSIAAAFAAPVLRALAARPLVAVLHQPPGGMEGGWARRRVQRTLDRAVYRRADLLLAASEALAEEVRASGLRGPMRVVPPGSDAPAAAGPGSDGPSATGGPGRDQLRAGRAVALLCVGNWVPRKGIVELLEALARVPPSAVTLHLVGHAGTGRYGRDVRRRLAQPDLAGRVVVHGVVPREEVARLYAAADGFVLASTVEPYGTVYAEALAAGLPVMGWRAGNLPHLAEQGRSGLMAEPGDVAGLAAALTAVADDPDLRARLVAGAAARGRALPRWSDTAEAFFAALRDVLATRG